jgi:hypothetical protein
MARFADLLAESRARRGIPTPEPIVAIERPHEPLALRVYPIFHPTAWAWSIVSAHPLGERTLAYGEAGSYTEAKSQCEQKKLAMQGGN